MIWVCRQEAWKLVMGTQNMQKLGETAIVIQSLKCTKYSKSENVEILRGDSMKSKVKVRGSRSTVKVTR